MDFKGSMVDALKFRDCKDVVWDGRADIWRFCCGILVEPKGGIIPVGQARNILRMAHMQHHLLGHQAPETEYTLTIWTREGQVTDLFCDSCTLPEYPVQVAAGQVFDLHQDNGEAWT